MSATIPSEELTAVVGDVAIYTHDTVLGVDIGVNQLEERCTMFGVRYPLADSYGDTVDINAVGSEQRLETRHRRYIAAWARRTLFGGDGE